MKVTKMQWPVFYLQAVRGTAAGVQIPVTPIVLPIKVNAKLFLYLNTMP
jgi:hypothetical protein